MVSPNGNRLSQLTPQACWMCYLKAVSGCSVLSIYLSEINGESEYVPGDIPDSPTRTAEPASGPSRTMGNSAVHWLMEIETINLHPSKYRKADSTPIPQTIHPLLTTPPDPIVHIAPQSAAAERYFSRSLPTKDGQSSHSTTATTAHHDENV